eukprot:TRINITY_DN5099_c2_g2_i1.p1 TRINITY_DN5099_c2_g2~~TRINITY_DN5099_c2_g2_i1.p1  ORF type:complete len:528 (+),score=181.33 TRINITY_DN5099_c2_g2_i1:189-1772(+)
MRAAAAVLLAAAVVADAAAGTGFRMTKEYLEANKESLWNTFKNSHMKVYANATEEAARKQVFLANMLSHLDLQGQNPHATFGPTIFADLTKEEFLSQRTGFRLPKNHLLKSDGQSTETDRYHVFSDEELRAAEGHVNLQGSMSATSVGGTPCVYQSINLNWAAAGVVTHVKNQGRCGGCWAFSAAGAIESHWAIQGHPLTSLSEQELVSCVSTCQGCDGGEMESAFEWLVTERQGVLTTEIAYPYEEEYWTKDQGKGDACKSNLNQMPVGAIVTGTTKYAHNEVQMYVGLKEHGPLSVAVDASNWQSYSGGVMTDCSSGTVNHGVLLVGHGYDPTADLEYWVIKNSWGSSWGESGYIRIQFGVDACKITTFVTAPTVQVATTPGFVPADPTPDGVDKAPGVVDVRPQSDPTAAAPIQIDSLVTCIKGEECDCQDMVIFKGKTGDTCVAVIVWPIVLVVASLLVGALCGSCMTRKGLSEDAVRKSIMAHKQREAQRRINHDPEDQRAFVRNQHVYHAQQNNNGYVMAS